jgi:hypothetical protein
MLSGFGCCMLMIFLFESRPFILDLTKGSNSCFGSQHKKGVSGSKEFITSL